MARFLSFFFLVVAIVRTYFDWAATQGYLGAEFYFAPIIIVWSEFHYESIEAFQAAVSSYLSFDFWENVVLPVLFWPMAPVSFALAVLFWVIRRRKPRISNKKRTTRSKESSGPVRRQR